MTRQSIYFMSSGRIGFRKWRGIDFELAMELWGDHRVMHLIDKRSPLTREQIKERFDREIENQKNFGISYWPFFDRNRGKHEFIGVCGLRPYGLQNVHKEMGFHLKHDEWRKGYGWEAANAVIDYAFSRLNIETLVAGHNPKNFASKGLLTKLGFKHFDEVFFEPTGMVHPIYELKKENWG